MTSYAGKRVRFGFCHVAARDSFNNASESTGWYIDNVQILATTSFDTDGDGMPDVWETDNGLDPNNPDDALWDKDNDGCNNLCEFLNDTDPDNPDTDGDTMPDGWEVRYGLDPNVPDTNCTGDKDGDGISDCDEYRYGLDPTSIDTGQVSLEPADLTLAIGGSGQYLLLVANTTIVPEEYTLSLTGLDPSWYTLSETDFLLLAGEEKEIQVDIHLPEDCNIAGQYPFTIQSTPAGSILITTVDSTLNVVQNPLLSGITPEDGEAMGANRLVISWTSDVPGTTEVFFRLQGETQFTSATGDPGTYHSLTLDSLNWDTVYEWYVQTESLCAAATSSTRSNSIEAGVDFENAPYTFPIERDYEQVATINVRNTDNEPHAVLLTIINDNDDLIAGFRGRRQH